jgi:nucleotide-binding universal stress UspA family protein
MSLSGKCIVVGTDFSNTARAALDWAVTIAQPLEARVVVVHTFDLPIIGMLPEGVILMRPEEASQLSDAAQGALDREVARVGTRGVLVEGCLLQGDPRVVVPSCAQSLDATLIVIGSNGRRGLARALLGSVAEAVLRASSLPVAVVREKEAP